MDIRHKKREEIIKELYSLSFLGSAKAGPKSAKVKLISQKKEEIDSYIDKYSSKFAADKIAKLDLAILHLSIYELIFEKSQPPKAIINEAVELAKEYGSEKSFSYINAILGKIYAEFKIKSQSSKSKSE